MDSKSPKSEETGSKREEKRSALPSDVSLGGHHTHALSPAYKSETVYPDTLSYIGTERPSESGHPGLTRGFGLLVDVRVFICGFVGQESATALNQSRGVCLCPHGNKTAQIAYKSLCASDAEGAFFRSIYSRTCAGTFFL